MGMGRTTSPRLKKAVAHSLASSHLPRRLGRGSGRAGAGAGGRRRCPLHWETPHKQHAQAHQSRRLRPCSSIGVRQSVAVSTRMCQRLSEAGGGGSAAAGSLGATSGGGGLDPCASSHSVHARSLRASDKGSCMMPSSLSLPASTSTQSTSAAEPGCRPSTPRSRASACRVRPGTKAMPSRCATDESKMSFSPSCVCERTTHRCRAPCGVGPGSPRLVHALTRAQCTERPRAL